MTVDVGKTVDVRKKVSDALIYLYAKEPFIGIFAKLTKIIIINVDDNRKIAWTDGRSIYLSRHAVTSYTVRNVAFLIAHEAMHMIMMHIPRMKQLLRKYPHAVINVAADALIHNAINDLITDEFRERVVTCDKLGNAEKRCKEMASLEELVELIYSQSQQLSIDDTYLIGDLDENINDNGNGEVVNEGDGEGDDEGDGEGDDEGDGEGDDEGDGEGDEKRIIKRIIKTYALSRLAGRVPGWADRWINELLKPKIDWRRQLRNMITINGMKVKRTWSRPSRKNPDADTMPGKALYGTKILILIDTSGSIDEEALRRFVSEVYAMAKEAEVIVIPWDAEVHGVFHIKRKEDIKKLKLYGGGGTMITPALKLLDSFHADRVVILSDWYIADLNEAEKLLRRHAQKIIAVTVGADPPPFLRRIRIPTS
ncbi:MAG: VWA-like domain-containing protein [Pyrobaculum sp.]